MNTDENKSLIQEDIFTRAEALLGESVMQRLKDTKVLIFGVGGVGSWCAEGLVRSGIGHITIVDFDVVSPSNINRQLMATSLVVGEPKVKVMQERLLQINPNVDVVAINARFGVDFYNEYPDFNLSDYEELCKGWEYLNQNYNGIFTPQEVWETYTELRSQTEINPETGTAKTASLRNMIVVDAGTKFAGVIELKQDNEVNESILEKALLNLRYAGTKRNRGFGHIKCTLLGSKEVR